MLVELKDKEGQEQFKPSSRVGCETAAWGDCGRNQDAGGKEGQESETKVVAAADRQKTVRLPWAQRRLRDSLIERSHRLLASCANQRVGMTRRMRSRAQA